MWNLKSAERLNAWREFRNEINQLPLEDALQKTTHLWSYAPYVNYYLSPDKNPEWPDPWTILYENYYCDIAKALGMLYTLQFSIHGKNLDQEIRIYYHQEEKVYYNLVWINQGKYVLNMIFDTVVNKQQLDKNMILKYAYTSTDLNLDRY
ncbi:MAG: hypothetical protein N2235_01475 [Fischerella sp.]|nr:hypothetical protein [Fischerella sp.]